MFRIVAAFDNDPQNIGQRLSTTSLGSHTVAVRPSDDLAKHVIAFDCTTAVLAVPPSKVQIAANTCVKAGVKMIINFSASPIHTQLLGTE